MEQDRMRVLSAWVSEGVLLKFRGYCKKRFLKQGPFLESIIKGAIGGGGITGDQAVGVVVDAVIKTDPFKPSVVAPDPAKLALARKALESANKTVGPGIQPQRTLDYSDSQA